MKRQNTHNTANAINRVQASAMVSNVLANLSTGKLIGKAAGGDFVVTYNTPNSLSCTNFPAAIVALSADDIVAVVQYDTSGNLTGLYGRSTNTMAVAAGVLTVYGATFVNTDTFIVYTNYAAAGSSSSGGASAGVDADVKIGTQTGTVTFATDSTVTLGGSYPAITNDNQLIYIRVTPAVGDSAIYVNGDGTHTLRHAGGTVTITGATPFVAGDQYEIGISAVPTGADMALDVIKIIEQSPLYARYTSQQQLIAAPQDLTALWVDLGSEVDCRGYNTIGIWITLDINDSTDARIKVLAKHTFGGAEEYSMPISIVGATDVKITEEYMEFDVDADQLIVISCTTANIIPYIQVQVQADVVGAVAGQIDAAYITKGY
jgi:hypothetical protein